MGGTAEGPPGRRAPRLARDVVVVAIGLALGVGLAYLLNGRLPGRDPGLPELELASPTPPPSSTVVPEEEPVEEPVPSAAVASAQAAVEGFLDAEMSGDLDASYRFLSEADRQAFGSPEGWVASHPDLLPPILGYRVEGVREEAGQVQVETLMELEPGLDHVMGLVPARAEGIWVSQEESEGWRVLLDQSALRPLYPEEEGAAEAVGHWVRARQGCGEGRQHPAGLLGVPSLADQLCGSQGEPRLGEVGQVEQLEAAPFLAAFGPEFQQWARVVPVAAPVPLRAVVAPIGDGWTVIGVLAAEQP